MTPTITLEHFYHGKLVQEGRTTGGFTITSHSAGLTLQQALDYFALCSMGSYGNIGIADLAYGLSFVKAGPGVYLASAAYPSRHKDRGHHVLEYHGTVLPVDPLDAAQGDAVGLVLDVFLRDAASPPIFAEVMGDLPPLPVVLPAMPVRERDLAALTRLIELVPDTDWLIAALSALLDGPALDISSAPPSTRETPVRVWLAQGLAALLPPPARAFLTFATEVFEPDKVEHARLKLLYASPYVTAPPGEVPLVWGETPQDAAPRHIYAEQIGHFWAQVDPQQPVAGLAALLDFVHGNIQPRFEKNRAARAVPLTLRVAARSAARANAFARGTLEAADLLDGLEEDYSLSEEERTRYLYALRACAEHGESRVIVERLLSPAYQPASLDRWQRVMPAVFRTRVDEVAASPHPYKGLASVFDRVYDRLDADYDTLAPRTVWLCMAHTPDEWLNLLGSAPAPGLSLVSLCLAVGQVETGLAVLSALDLAQAAPGQAANAGSLLADLARDSNWAHGAVNEQLGRLWAHRLVDLQEDEAFYLLERVRSRDIEDAMLARLFDDILRLEDRAERARLLRRAADSIA